MPILNIQLAPAGLTGVVPNIVYINTNDTLATVTATGYLNQAVQSGYNFSNGQMALITTQTSNTASPDVGFLEVIYVAPNWSLTSSAAPGDVTLPTIANHIATFINTTGGISKDAATAINGGNIQAGLSGTAGTLASFPATASTGSLVIAGVSNSSNTNTTISNAAMGQASVISIPDPGAATAKFVLDTGTNATGTFTKLSAGATPVAIVDPGSCTITAAAGAANTSTITIQLKDGAGANIAGSLLFRVYASSASNGLTLASAASTGFSVASGGLSLANGTAVTTQITAMSSATGGCVLSLLDTGKQTSYLVLSLPNGNKISAQLSAGSYG